MQHIGCNIPEQLGAYTLTAVSGSVATAPLVLIGGIPPMPQGSRGISPLGDAFSGARG